MSEQAEKVLNEQAARYGAIPHFAPVLRWCDISGVGRTTTYELLDIGFLKAVKLGSKTLIDVWHGLDQLSAPPAADIRPMGRRADQATVQPNDLGQQVKPTLRSRTRRRLAK